MRFAFRVSPIQRLLPASIAAVAALVLPPEPARSNELLASMPPRLSIAFVLEAAKKSAAVFRAADALEGSVDAPMLQANAPLAPRLSIGVRRLDDRQEPANPFAPRGTDATGYFARVEQGVSLTGTRLALELQHGRTALDFPTVPLAPYFETRLALTASQSLWQGLWLGADRKRSLSGRAGSRAATLTYRLEQDRATMELVTLYYRAWLGQADVRAAAANLESKRKLLDVTRLRARRGTAERPDLLQAEAGLAMAQTQNEEAARSLRDVWEALIVSLDLPRALVARDPLTVPMDLDSPHTAASLRCAGYAQAPDARAQAIANQLAQARAEAAEARAASLGALSGFDLVASGTYGANGIDSLSRGDTWSQALRRETRVWSLELAAQIPLGPSSTEGDRRQAATDAIRARAAADGERDRETIDRVALCRALEHARRAHGSSERIFSAQAERLRLEERRFSIGRSSVAQVVLASDDRVQAERGLRQAEVEQRLAGWQVLAIEGGLFEKGVAAQGAGMPGASR